MAKQLAIGEWIGITLACLAIVLVKNAELQHRMAISSGIDFLSVLNKLRLHGQDGDLAPKYCK